jgi:glycerol kinase
MMMNLETLDWDDEILGILGVPRAMLPGDQGLERGHPAEAKGDLDGISVAGDLGDSRRRSSARPASRSARRRTLRDRELPAP